MALNKNVAKGIKTRQQYQHKRVAKGIKTRQENELLKNNKLIAEFLRANKQPDRIDADVYEYEMYGIIECIEDGEDEKHFYHPEEMLFHTWRWLMPVVDKINETGRFEVIIGYGTCHITDSEGELTLSLQLENTRGVVYNTVVEFIKWYNRM
jgi:hypothetical protein